MTQLTLWACVSLAGLFFIGGYFLGFLHGITIEGEEEKGGDGR